MALRNFYVILGVASDATEQGVRAAFRDLAKRYHPDRVGPAGAAPFREVVEAYETLSDPERRSDYDAALERSAARRLPVEPLCDSLRSAARKIPVRDVSLRSDFADVRPSDEALFARFARNFTGVGVPKSEHVDELQIEVAISEEEAGRGAEVHLGVPVFVECARCYGRGCVGCAGQGVIERERPVNIALPPMSGSSGATFVMPLSQLGIRNLYVRVRVRIDKEMAPRDAR